MRRYDAVLFDAGETLLHPHPSFGGLLHELLAGHGHVFDVADVEKHARDAFLEAADAATRDRVSWSVSNDASRSFWTGLYATLLRSLGVADDVGKVCDAIYDEFTQPHRYTLFPDALPALRELKSHGYRLGVISNWEDWLGSVLERLQVMPLLDVAIVSGAEGLEKPDPAIFELALSKMGVEPDRACYVGDSPVHDIAPALSLGMGAVLIDRRRRFDRAHRPTIESLGQLTGVL